MEIRTKCARSGRAMRITADGEMRIRVHDEGAAPLVFEPQVDWSTFREPNIIHSY